MPVTPNTPHEYNDTTYSVGRAFLRNLLSGAQWTAQERKETPTNAGDIQKAYPS